jgi:hypothetical protein
MKGVGEQHIKEALELFFGPGGRVRPDSGRWSSRGGDDDDEEEEEDDPRDRECVNGGAAVWVAQSVWHRR